MEEIKAVEVETNKMNLKPFGFTNVRKETAGETFKYWNKLLKSKSFEYNEDFTEIMSPKVPLSPLEEKLKLILIDTLHLKNEVVNVLLSQNDYAIKRILKCKWFFQNLSAEFCTKEIFPRVSVSLRFKIINRLSRYIEREEEAEKFFAFIKSNFASETAELLLPKCSSEFILNYCKKIKPLLEYPIDRRQRILKKICERYPETGLQILALRLDNKKKYCSYHLGVNHSLLQYLAGNHTDLFIPFFKKYADQFYPRTFSGKLTRKLLKKLKDFLFESKLINSNILKENYLFSMLDTNDKIKFLATKVLLNGDRLTFRNWLDAAPGLACLIKCIGPSCRYQLIRAVFKEVYNLNFQDHSKCWTSDLLELLPPNDRQYFVEIIEKFYYCTDTEFRENVDSRSFQQEEPEGVIYLYEFNTAFDKFKNIIAKTPDKYRRKMIMLQMVKCCEINKDANGLEKVVDYIATRHRNEDPQTLYEFANCISDRIPGVELTENICEKVGNLLFFCCAKGFFESYSFKRFTERSIYLRLENDKETDDLVKKFFEFAVLKSGHSMSFLSDCKNKHSRTLLLAIGEEIKRWAQTHPTDHNLQLLHSAWINTCNDFNNNNKKNKVVLGDVPGLAETLKEVFKTKYVNLGIEAWPLDTIKKCDVRLLNHHFISRFLCFLLKRSPEVIINRLELIPDHLDFRFYPLLVKRLTLLGANDKLKEITLNTFRKGNSFGKRQTALRMYSHLCTIEEFTDVVKEYIPEDDQVKEGADYDFTQIQLVVPTVIKNIRPRWKNLNLILKFFRGDFLKPVMFSFYASCYHSRVDFIVPFLKEHLFTVPQKVSYMKDILKLICKLSDRGEKVNFCLKCWKDNQHYSMRTIILQFLWTSFLEDPTRDLFNALMKCILDTEQIVVMDAKLDCKKIPDEFLNEYASTLWKFSQNTNGKQYFQRMLVANFNLENINLLSEEFCDEVIKGNLFNRKKSVSVEEFAALYCAADADTMNSRIQMILNLMRESQVDAQRAAAFLKIVRTVSLNNPARFTNVISIFLKNWPDYHPHGLYEEKLLYTYYDLYYRILQTSKEQSVVSVEFGKQLKTLYSGMKDLTDLVIIVLETLNQFMCEVTGISLPLHPLLVVRELIVPSPGRAFAIIALGALPHHLLHLYQKDDAFKANGDRTKFNELFKIFENMNDDILWVYFRRTFKEFDNPVQ